MIEPSDETLRLWLLHRQAPSDVEMLEQALLQDEAFAIRLRAIETDLLDDFAGQRLSDDDRDAVATHLLATPDDRARLRIAVALARRRGIWSQQQRTANAHRHGTAVLAESSRRVRRRIAGGLLASACAAVIAVVGLRHHGGIERPAMPDAVVTVALLADQQRGAPREEVRIPHAASTIRLQVEVGAAAARDRYTLSIAEGARTVFSARDLVAHVAGPYRFVEVTFAARTLPDGTYRVRVASQGAAASEMTWSIRGQGE